MTYADLARVMCDLTDFPQDSMSYLRSEIALIPRGTLRSRELYVKIGMLLEVYWSVCERLGVKPDANAEKYCIQEYVFRLPPNIGLHVAARMDEFPNLTLAANFARELARPFL